MKLLVVTGLSGAGKSLAVNALEDIGYFCIDNIPAGLLPRILDFAQQGENMLEKVAVVLDVRGCRSPVDITAALDSMDKSKITYQILFLDSADEVLERRYKETRRMHPLSSYEGLSTSEAIGRERARAGAAAPAVRKGRLCGGYLAAFHRAEQRAHLQPFFAVASAADGAYPYVVRV